jgi:serine/threonine protein kinase
MAKWIYKDPKQSACHHSNQQTKQNTLHLMPGTRYLDFAVHDLKETRVRDVPFLLPERYIIDKAIGKGSYGMVVSCLCLVNTAQVEALDQETDLKVAIKKNKDVFPVTERRKLNSRRTATIEAIPMPDSMNAEDDEDALLRASRLLREVKIMIHLEHENVIRLQDVILPPDFDSFKDIYFVMDLMVSLLQYD